MGAAICAAAALLDLRGAQAWWWASRCWPFALVLMSTSKHLADPVVLAGGALGLAWAVRRGPVAGIAATWAAVAGLLLICAVVFFASDAVFGLLGKDATLTGRTQIWVRRRRCARSTSAPGSASLRYARDLGRDRPGGARWPGSSMNAFGFRPHHAHNAWLEQRLGDRQAGPRRLGLLLRPDAGRQPGGALPRQGRLPGAAVLRGLFGLDQPHRERSPCNATTCAWVIFFVALAVKLALPDPPQRRAQPSAEPRRALGHRHRLEAVR